MTPHNVEYQISLKDLLSGKIKQAEGHVNHFEHTLEHTRDITKEMMGAAVGFFGLYQGVEFIKSSVEAYNSVEKSLSQLKAGIESTGGAAGVTYDELVEGADKFAGSTIYNKETLLDMQAQLLSFPEITKEVFEDAEQAVLDLATRTGHSAHDVSIMVGKALGDPAKGVSALRRVGVEFSEQQTEIIKKLATTGHLVEAQQMVLKELNKEYAGSTAAASATAGGQLEILKHQFDEVKESVGKLVMEEVIHLAPTIKAMIENFKHFTEWVDKNKDTIVDVGKAIAEVIAVMWAWEKTTAIITTATGAWEALAGAVGKVKGAMEGAAVAQGAIGEVAIGAEGAEVGAAAGALSIPGIGEIVAGVMVTAAVVAGAVALYNHIKNSNEETTRNNKEYTENAEVNNRIGHGVDELSYLQQNSKSESNSEFFGKRQQDMYGTQYEDILEVRMRDKGKKYADMMMGHNKEMFHDLAAAAQTDKGLVLTKSGEKSYEPLLEFFKKEEEKFLAIDLGKHGDKKANDILTQNQTNVQGQSVKNIYVTVNGGLVHEFTVNSGSVKEAAPDIKMIVEGVIADALNDAEITN